MRKLLFILIILMSEYMFAQVFENTSEFKYEFDFESKTSKIKFYNKMSYEAMKELYVSYFFNYDLVSRSYNDKVYLSMSNVQKSLYLFVGDYYISNGSEIVVGNKAYSSSTSVYDLNLNDYEIIDGAKKTDKCFSGLSFRAVLFRNSNFQCEINTSFSNKQVYLENESYSNYRSDMYLNEIVFSEKSPKKTTEATARCNFENLTFKIFKKISFSFLYNYTEVIRDNHRLDFRSSDGGGFNKKYTNVSTIVKYENDCFLVFFESADSNFNDIYDYSLKEHDIRVYGFKYVSGLWQLRCLFKERLNEYFSPYCHLPGGKYSKKYSMLENYFKLNDLMSVKIYSNYKLNEYSDNSIKREYANSINFSIETKKTGGSINSNVKSIEKDNDYEKDYLEQVSGYLNYCRLLNISLRMKNENFKKNIHYYEISNKVFFTKDFYSKTTLCHSITSEAYDYKIKDELRFKYLNNLSFDAYFTMSFLEKKKKEAKFNLKVNSVF